MELVFFPVPTISHLVSHVEFAKRLLEQDGRFSIIVLVVDPFSSPKIQSYVGSLAAAAASDDDARRLRFITFPHLVEADPLSTTRTQIYAFEFLECHKLSIKEFIINQIFSNYSVSAAGFVLDFFTTPMIDVANDLGLPSYIFYTSSAASLGFVLHVVTRHDEVGREFRPSDGDLVIPRFANTVLLKVIPSFLFDETGGYICFINFATRLKETKAIIVNSFQELESQAVKSLLEHHDCGIPPFYLVGPVLDLQAHSSSLCDEVQGEEIKNWLHHQRPSTVIFLCFGSVLDMDKTQAAEIAKGLQQCGHRFLWSIPIQSNCTTDLKEILPEGFLQRTEGRGLACGWAPQIEVLAHESIRGFVSHCGWNSILIWYGVPILTWPMHSEQQMNAFQMVKDLGLAVEMRMDYKQGESDLVMADEIEKGIKCLMDGYSEVRKRVKKMSQVSREAVSKNSKGTTFTSYSHFIDLFMIHGQCR